MCSKFTGDGRLLTASAGTLAAGAAGFSDGRASAREGMLWILRRSRITSGAAALLNTINNNTNTNHSHENRPARKDYNKLSGGHEQSKSGKVHAASASEDEEQLDNQETCGGIESSNHTPGDSDTDSSFTDLEMDNRDDFSDDSDYEEALTCNVCDRSFSSLKQLSSHKQKKRHFGCSGCDSIFPSLMLLEHHKEEFEHWSESDDDVLTDSDEEDTVISEECERLL